MTSEQYFAACWPIHKQLADIAGQTRVMALAKSAHMDNPRFADAIARQDELLKELSTLDSKVVI
ncbi:hypothetical protein LJR118_006708 [Acidovorax sp. LjRoot118]|uniref:hypothetical protein n=1 Tax=Acidovorax sp. LjRoot118 TaxID=3342256 RepID=UPI003ECF8B39